jgi:hypothetical protein
MPSTTPLSAWHPAFHWWGPKTSSRLSFITSNNKSLGTDHSPSRRLLPFRANDRHGLADVALSHEGRNGGRFEPGEVAARRKAMVAQVAEFELVSPRRRFPLSIPDTPRFSLTLRKAVRIRISVILPSTNVP